MDEELLQEFLAESWENLARLDQEIVRLEHETGNAELLDSIFRTIHTIKGTCGFIGLVNLGTVTHSTENVLGKMRERELPVTRETISLVLKAVDAIKALLEGIEATNSEPQTDHTRLLAQLDAMATGTDLESESDGDEVTVESPIDSVCAASQADLEESSEADGSLSSDQRISDSVWDSQSAAADPSSTETGRRTAADLSIRVNVDVLDGLMDLVGELVLTRNQLLQLARADEESQFGKPITHLNRVTSDLQEGVMKTRMQPIGNAWSRLPRLIRDLEQTTGKSLRLQMSGSETELDRTVLDAIKDPLTHMIRNSADHGIETREARRAVGKQECGTIRLEAHHEGGHVIISIADDGGGIDPEKIKRKAVDRGLITFPDAERLSEQDALQFIFHAGFSTAEKISSVSGRGVGMDVVRTAIEEIGGTIDLNSIVGVGTTIRVKIPLTLAIISALIVESGGECFAIPQLGIVELVRVSAEDSSRIEQINGKKVLRLREHLLPLVHLGEVLDLESRETSDDQTCLNIVVAQIDDMRFGLTVDEVFDTEEIVVKPLGRLLRELPFYQGTTILGDGRVIMILDVAGIATSSGAFDGTVGKPLPTPDENPDTAGVITTLLLFDPGHGRTMAVPLGLVARIEEFPVDRVEQTGEGPVIQYRGTLLPLLPMDNGSHPVVDSATQPVIVFTEGDCSMGLMVREILDIREVMFSIERPSRIPGILGTSIVDGKATEIIDAQHYVTSATPEWFNRSSSTDVASIVVVDDSLFFRQLVKTSLESAGFDVAAFGGAAEALTHLERNPRVDLVIADIDMPQTDGLEFARQVREYKPNDSVPMIALSGHETEKVKRAALDAGYDRFLKKFDSREVAAAIRELYTAPILAKAEAH
ncbi:hybrid sensor histidine kinase/response regulator [Stratiformator vulcanicus]|uniref:histidine kinase n=1 Tax=Stratiformator vulcanicus TaxID=2527980 RepID=A0A517R1V0_9PLAN|nr:chemotaxis protein CheW [Stratiformator vulcanicus]QDT37824.1 Chemotaxis protein CheA [Stratiformator vulcanicus]